MKHFQVITTTSVRFLVLGAGFAVSIVTARALGPEGRGDYYFVLTVAYLVAQFGTLGLSSSNTYYAAKEPKLVGKLLANSVWVSLAVGLLATVALGVFVLLGGTERGHAPSDLWLAGLLAPLVLFPMLGSSLLVALDRVGAYNVFQLASGLFNLLIITGASVSGLGVGGVLWGSIVSALLSAMVLLFALYRTAGADFRFDYPTFSCGLRYAGKAYLVTLIGFVIMRCNLLLVAEQSGSKEAGYYSVAMQIVDALVILPQSASLLLFPHLVRQGGSYLFTTLRSLAWVGSVLGLCCLLTAVLAHAFVQLAFGERFLPTVAILRWMLPGAFFIGLSSIASQPLAALGFPWELIAIWLTALCAATALNWWLIPAYGSLGAAAAFSITFALLFFAVLALAWKKDQVSSADPGLITVASC